MIPDQWFKSLQQKLIGDEEPSKRSCTMPKPALIHITNAFGQHLHQSYHRWINYLSETNKNSIYSLSTFVPLRDTDGFIQKINKINKPLLPAGVSLNYRLSCPSQHPRQSTEVLGPLKGKQVFPPTSRFEQWWSAGHGKGHSNRRGLETRLASTNS